jgi:hypothetical protein
MLSTRCLKLAGLNLVLGMSLGIFMGATENFPLGPGTGGNREVSA